MIWGIFSRDRSWRRAPGAAVRVEPCVAQVSDGKPCMVECDVLHGPVVVQKSMVPSVPSAMSSKKEYDEGVIGDMESRANLSSSNNT